MRLCRIRNPLLAKPEQFEQLYAGGCVMIDLSGSSLPLLSFRPDWLTEWKRAYPWTLDPTFRFLCLDWSSSIANFAAPHHRRQLGDAWRRSAVVGSSIFCTVAQMS